MSSKDKPLVWLNHIIKTPPFSTAARLETGFLLRTLQRGDKLSMPHSRPMPAIKSACHELRIIDGNKIWRIIYHIDTDAIVIAEVFQKKTKETPKSIIEICKKRLRMYDDESSETKSVRKKGMES